jgi:protocatechuate 3,4-dioxygenase beta subunit
MNSGIVTTGITVNPVNDPPSASGEAYTTDEDIPLTVAAPGVLSNDTDIESPLTAVLVTGPANGTLALNPDGSYTYSPNLNWFGADGFTYKANDGALDSNIVTVNITVNPVNDVPTISAIPDQVVYEDTTVGPLSFVVGDVESSPDQLQVLASSSDQLFIPDAYIQLTGTGANRTIFMRTGEHQFGTTTITITASDGGATGFMNFNVYILEVDDFPVVVINKGLTVDEDASASVIGSDLLRVTDVETGPAQIILTLEAVPAKGVLGKSGTPLKIGDKFTQDDINNGQIDYTPSADENGSDSFGFTAADETGNTSPPSSFAITITPVNDPPEITGQKEALSVPENGTLTITLNDLDVKDVDNVYPSDFSLIVKQGTGYAVEGTTIKPLVSKGTILKVLVKVNDGQADSKDFSLSVLVTGTDTGTWTLNGTLNGFEPGTTVVVNIFSASLGFSQSQTLTSGPPVFYFEGLEPADDYHLEIVSSDYLYQLVVLTPEDFASGVQLTLVRPSGVISGVVIFPNGAIPGYKAMVSAFSSSSSSGGEAQIELGGTLEVQYRIDGLMPGDDYVVSVWPENYQNQYYSGAENEKDATRIHTASPEAGQVNFTLKPGAVLSGRVNGVDPEGIYVELRNAAGESVKMASLLEDGSFMIEGIPQTGEFYLVVIPISGPPVFYSEGGPVWDIGQASRITPETGHVEITLAAGEGISGTVFDKAGQPISGVWVEARSESRQAGSGAYTRGDGTYEIKELPKAEDYAVTAGPDFLSDYVEETIAGVMSGDREVNFFLSVRESYKITGKITDTTGKPIANANVEVRSDSMGFTGAYSPGGGGQDFNPYQIAGLPPADDYVITVQPPAGSAYGVFTEKGVSIKGDTSMDIVLTGGLTISDIVQSQDGSPIEGVVVTLVSEEKNFRAQTVTDASGRYTFTNVPEASDYKITVTPPEGYSEGEVTKDLSNASEIMIITLESGKSITGTVKTNTGNPVPGVLVEAYSAGMGNTVNFAGVAVSDAAGAYDIPGLRDEDDQGSPVNDYVVTVYPENLMSQSVSGVSAGAKLDFTLEQCGPATGISGRATDSSGNPFEYTLVDVFENRGGFIKTASAGSDGSFEISCLPEGIQVQLRFTAYVGDTESVQWAGEGDIGFDEPGGPVNPDGAKVYSSGDTLNFIFSGIQAPVLLGGKNSDPARVLRSRTKEPAAISLLEVPGEEDIQDLRSTEAGAVTNTPNVTVKWNTAPDNPDARYYYLFNQKSDFTITKRNVPVTRPVKATRATSIGLKGDDVPYGFHVASVDDRGRISPTKGLGFRIDTVAPFNAVVMAPRYTLSSGITMLLGSTGATEVYISNTNYGEGGRWEKLISSRDWTLTTGEGLKKVYVQFRDRAKNTANALVLIEKVLSLPDSYVITASAGQGGRISPSGQVTVFKGEDMTFTITPETGYETSQVLVNGQPVTLTGNAYTFQNVEANASISASFSLKSVPAYTITASAGPNGSLNPAGQIMVREGESITFTVTPNPGYEVESVLIDGKAARLNGDNIRFINVSKNYTLSAAFKPAAGSVHTIRASADAHAVIMPSGTVSVSQGDNITFSIESVPGYAVQMVYVDGNPVDLADGAYTFVNVTADHAIQVTAIKGQ